MYQARTRPSVGALLCSRAGIVLIDRALMPPIRRCKSLIRLKLRYCRNDALPDIHAEPTMLPVAERVIGVDKKGIIMIEL